LSLDATSLTCLIQLAKSRNDSLTSTFGYLASNCLVSARIALRGPPDPSEDTTRSVTGPSLSKPSVLTCCACAPPCCVVFGLS
jgi:hypothetical protein